MIIDNIFDLISNKNKKVILNADAPILRLEEIEAILMSVVNNDCQDIAMILSLIEVFRIYLSLKKGETHEVVITGRELFESMLQEDFQPYYWSSYQ